MTSLLVVAGEASGDRAAAAVVRRLDGVKAFGLGGAARCRPKAQSSSAIFALPPPSGSQKLPHALAAFFAPGVLSFERRGLRRPRAALLVLDYSEFNAHLAPRLHARGIRVLWYGAPQVWAWRPGRIQGLRPFVDRMAVMLPFEEALWRAGGVDAHYVGHPSFEAAPLDRASAREALGLTATASTVAILPGSRPHEVQRLLVPMLDAYESVRCRDRASVDARVLVASSLDASTQTWTRAVSARLRVPTVDVDARIGAAGMLRAFDASLCASGTVSLEAALARAVPADLPTASGSATSNWTARAFVRSPHIGLPNVLLGRRVFTELVQHQVNAQSLADALADALDRRDELVDACDAVERAFGDTRTPSSAVARMLTPWLEERVRAA